MQAFNAVDSLCDISMMHLRFQISCATNIGVIFGAIPDSPMTRARKTFKSRDWDFTLAGWGKALIIQLVSRCFETSLDDTRRPTVLHRLLLFVRVSDILAILLRALQSYSRQRNLGSVILNNYMRLLISDSDHAISDSTFEAHADLGQ